MVEREYLTQRGALLSRMEARCEQPGLWLIEGYQVRRNARGRWIIPKINGGCVCESFEEALQVLADYLDEVG